MIFKNKTQKRYTCINTPAVVDLIDIISNPVYQLLLLYTQKW